MALWRHESMFGDNRHPLFVQMLVAVVAGKTSSTTLLSAQLFVSLAAHGLFPAGVIHAYCPARIHLRYARIKIKG